MENKSTTKKPKKNKCYLCHKKLSMIQFTCKCNHIYCIQHMNPHSHNCIYDYKSEKQKLIKLHNPSLNIKIKPI